MSSKIRLAVVGTGHLGRIHARLAAAIDAFHLAGVVDPDEKARDAAATELGVPAFARHEEIIDQIDAAVIAAPTCYHHEVAQQLLSAGIHLLVEKPLAASLAEAEDIVQCAARNRRVLQVGHIERFNPAWLAAAPHVQSPKFIEARRFSGYTGRSTDIGVVLDVMIHDLDLVLAVADSRPTQVDALGACVIGDLEDVATARIQFANGCVANVSASRVSFGRAREMQIWCPEAFVGLNFADSTATVARPSTAILNHELEPTELAPSERRYLSEHLFEEFLPVEHLKPASCNALADELSDFAAAITSGASPRVPGSAGRDALALAEQILHEIEHHRWDGTATGRIGPLAVFAPATVRAPIWDMPHRKAG